MKIESQGLSLNGYVIVVEDDLTLRMVLTDILSELGGQVCGFDNADDALVHLLASHGECSLVIADHGVPGALKGLEFIQMVREKWPHMPTVLTSGFQADGIGDVQPVAFLFKPWTVEELIAAIKSSISQTSAIRQQGADQPRD